MALTTRLLLFFLSLLALVLICFSVILYVFAHYYLYQSADERLKLIASAVTSGIESSSEGLEWEPEHRHFQIESPLIEGEFAWVVTDERGKVVERSSNVDAEMFFAVANARRLSGTIQFTWNDQSWRAARQRVEAKNHQERESDRASDSDRQGRFSELIITSGISVSPIEALLRRLAASLVGLSTLVWLIGLLSGRWICRQALSPVSRMAKVAAEIDAKNLARRLPRLGSGDELEDLSRSFNQLLDRLQEAFERQQRFTGEASHQLRTPLTVLLGQIEVTLSRVRTADEYQRVLTLLQQNSQHLSRVVDSLLFLARADSEAASPAFERVDVADWLSNHLQTWSTHPRFSDMVLIVGESHDCFISTHSALLGELLNILLDNAGKYSHPQTPITVEMSYDDASATISVSDLGCGIDDQEMHVLFTPFRRSERARLSGVPGVGLGLSIAKRLAGVLGCELTVVSKLNEGSQFRLRFQRAD